MNDNGLQVTATFFVGCVQQQVEQVASIPDHDGSWSPWQRYTRSQELTSWSSEHPSAPVKKCFLFQRNCGPQPTLEKVRAHSRSLTPRFGGGRRMDGSKEGWTFYGYGRRMMWVTFDVRDETSRKPFAVAVALVGLWFFLSCVRGDDADESLSDPGPGALKCEEAGHILLWWSHSSRFQESEGISASPLGSESSSAARLTQRLGTGACGSHSSNRGVNRSVL